MPQARHYVIISPSRFMYCAVQGTDLYVRTEAQLVCTCGTACGGYFRILGEGGEPTEKLPFDATESMLMVGPGPWLARTIV